MNEYRSSILAALVSLVVSGAALAERPATLVGQVSLGGRLIANARIEVTMVRPGVRQAAAQWVASTNGNGRFVVTGLSPADRYAVRVILSGVVSAFGFVDDVRAGDVRHIYSDLKNSCGTTYWQESQLAPGETSRVFVWPARGRPNGVVLCE